MRLWLLCCAILCTFKRVAGDVCCGGSINRWSFQSTQRTQRTLHPVAANTTPNYFTHVIVIGPGSAASVSLQERATGMQCNATSRLSRQHLRANTRARTPPSFTLQCRCHAPDDGPPVQGVALQRREFLAVLSTAGAATALSLPLPAAAQPSAGAPDLPLTFTSTEGFAFDYPESWVVAFDRSGGRGDGAVASIGDFRQLLVVSVFRTVANLPDSLTQTGALDEATGFAVCVEPQRSDESTMRFESIVSAASPGAGGGTEYNFEYELESCRGEIQEGSGGVLRCLVSLGALSLLCACILSVCGQLKSVLCFGCRT